MKAILMDTYRYKDKIMVWLKTPESDIKLIKTFCSKVYLENTKLAKFILKKYGFLEYKVKKLDYYSNEQIVYEVNVDKISSFERLIKAFEKDTKHRLNMYNADISPEQMFLYQNNLRPFSLVEIHGNKIIPIDKEIQVPVQTLDLDIVPTKDIRQGSSEVKKIVINNKEIIGREFNLLKQFAKKFKSIDPDVIYCEGAFSKIPYLVKRLNYYGIKVEFHRWNPRSIRAKGGKSFMSYGRIVYRDFAIRLNGRFLLDSSSTVGSECNVDAIIELSNLTGTRFAQVGSRSFGAAFQHSLVRQLVRKNYLVPFKEKPVDPPITLHTMLKFDRVGHTFDAKIGLHHDVAEIDFSSLFPWIIYNYNVSAETILSKGAPYQTIPGLPIKISLKKKGVVPIAIKPLIDRRMYYKKNPTAVNKVRTLGLKWVLVTSYGYLRFREFKLGIASSHMAIGAFAREIMMKTKEICESYGYEIVHGIIDSLYIKKKGINNKDVKEICREIELEIGIPVSFEGIFKWIVFLPSVNDDSRPVPTRYYGVFNSGKIKARGLEVRQAGSPIIVKEFQTQVLQLMSNCSTKKDIMQLFSYMCKILRKFLFTLPMLDAKKLSSFVRISKTEYKKNIPQKQAVDQLRKKGITPMPGQKVYFLYTTKGVKLPEDYDKKPDMERYKRLFVRSLFVLLQPFGFTKQEINELTKNTRQSRLVEYAKIRNQIMLTEL